MNGLDDLRGTLEQHAHDVVAHDAVARRTAVHHRIGVVRRRRRVAVAGAAALAVVAAVGVTTLGGDRRDSTPPQPAERVFGQAVPATMTSLGFRYELDDVTEGIGSRVEVDLGEAESTRLVTWTTEGDDQRVRLSGYGFDPVRYSAPDFGDWVVVQGDQPLTIEAQARDGAIALAVYTIDPEERPDGVTGGGATFRRSVDDQVLVDAVVGEPGQTELTLPGASRRGNYSYYAFCAGGADDLGLEVFPGSKAGGLSVEGGCAQGVPLDAASGTGRQSIRLDAGEPRQGAGTGLQQPGRRRRRPGARHRAVPDRCRPRPVRTATAGRVRRTHLAPGVDPGRAAGRGRLVHPGSEWDRPEARHDRHGLRGQGEHTVTILLGRSTPSTFSGQGAGVGTSSLGLVEPGGTLRYEVDSGELAAATAGFYVRAD